MRMDARHTPRGRKGLSLPGRGVFRFPYYEALLLRKPKGWTPRFPPFWESRFLCLAPSRSGQHQSADWFVPQCHRDLDRQRRKGKACDVPRENSFRGGGAVTWKQHRTQATTDVVTARQAVTPTRRSVPPHQLPRQPRAQTSSQTGVVRTSWRRKGKTGVKRVENRRLSILLKKTIAL